MTGSNGYLSSIYFLLLPFQIPELRSPFVQSKRLLASKIEHIQFYFIVFLDYISFFYTVMRKTIAIILGAFMFMAVPFVSYGSDDAKTSKTEVIYEPSILEPSPAVAVTVPSFCDPFTIFNYVAGPILETSLTSLHVNVGLHNRWYIDTTRETVWSYKAISGNSSTIRHNGPINTSVNMWCRSASL